MRIIYLVIGGASGGVKKKLKDKTELLKNSGLDVSLAFTTLDYSERAGDQHYPIHVDNSISSFLGKIRIIWRLSVFFEQWETYKAIKTFLRGHEFDLILFRYPVADYFLWRLAARYRRKIIFEHNTLEVKELRLRKNNSFWFKYFYYSEIWFGGKVRKLAKGLVGVTDEIIEEQVRVAQNNPPHTTISNGINVHRVRMRSKNPFDGSVLKLLFLAGSEAPWHGVDILVKSLDIYHGDCNVHCYIAGNIDSQSRSVAEKCDKITLLSIQEGDGLDEWCDHCHVGIGSLGLNRFLNEGCTLKVREYWSRGMPFVLGYKDVDLIGNDEMNAFYLRVHINDDGYFDLEEVVRFAENVYRVNDLSEKMRTLAFNSIHYEVKADQYASFFNSLPA